MSLGQKAAQFAKAPWQERINQIHGLLVRVKTALYYRRIFAELGSGSLLYKPLLLSGTQYIRIGAGTLIRQGARIEALLLDPGRPPSLEIGNNVNIEQNVHIICSSSIRIGDDVTITGNCSVVDTTHPFRDVDDPVKIGARIDPTHRPVEIGEGTFVGIGCVILPNVRIGKHCVIGSNSTVTHDIPDYCVAMGSPARVQQRYDFKSKSWVREEAGRFRLPADERF
jgi:acetyltransferase-like isoleucine patch superfamily enzyme